MSLQAYVDDSKKMLGRRSLVLAGYINFSEKWSEFNQEWLSVLGEGRKIEYMHMVEAEAARGQFKGWGHLDREIKVGALANVILGTNPWSFHVSVDLTDFEDVFDAQLPYGFQNPYLICFIAVSTQIGRHAANLGVDGPVDIFFDEQDSIRRAATVLYPGMKAMEPEERRSWMGTTPRFCDDKQILPLQAADMLAWHVQREMAGGHLRPKRRVSNILIQDGRHSYTHVNRVALEGMREKILELPSVPSLTSKSNWKSVISEISAIESLSTGEA